MIFLTFAEMCDALPEDFHWGEPLTPAVFKHIESAIEQAARATPADHSWDSVIEEVVHECSRHDWIGADVADVIRALKSQQDAAIESQRSGEGS